MASLPSRRFQWHGLLVLGGFGHKNTDFLIILSMVPQTKVLTFLAVYNGKPIPKEYYMGKRILIVSILAFLVLSGITCSNSTSPANNGGGATTLSGTSITYSTIPGDSVGDTIVEIKLQPNRCNGNNLVVGTQDTSKELYKFSGDSLLTTNGSLTATYFSNFALRNTTIWYVFLGGTHSGLSFSGTWTLVGAKGDPSTARTDSIIAAQLPNILEHGITFSATGNQIQSHSSITFATDFIASWNALDSAFYSIVVTNIAPNMVTLTGDSSHYTATVWEDASGNVSYSNSYSEYGPYTYYANPSACPDNPRPVWWNQFLNANRK